MKQDWYWLNWDTVPHPTLQADVAKYFLVGVSYLIGEADTALQTDTFSCATTAKGTFAGQNPAAGVSLVVNCPAGCAASVDNKVYTAVAEEYLWTSSVCRSAMHAGMLGDAGGPVQLTLKTGSGENREWLQSELMAVLWGCWLLWGYALVRLLH